MFPGGIIGRNSSNPLSGIVVLWDRYGAPTQGRTPSAARALLRLTDCGLLISLRTLLHEYHAAASSTMGAPILGPHPNGGDPYRTTNEGRTLAISGSRPYANHTTRFYRESAASLCSATTLSRDESGPPSRGDLPQQNARHLFQSRGEARLG